MERSGARPEFIARKAWANQRALGIQYRNLTPADELVRITARNIDAMSGLASPEPEAAALTERDAFLVMTDYSWRYAQPAGDDLITLIGGYDDRSGRSPVRVHANDDQD